MEYFRCGGNQDRVCRLRFYALGVFLASPGPCRFGRQGRGRRGEAIRWTGFGCATGWRFLSGVPHELAESCRCCAVPAGGGARQRANRRAHRGRERNSAKNRGHRYANQRRRFAQNCSRWSPASRPFPSRWEQFHAKDSCRRLFFRPTVEGKFVPFPTDCSLAARHTALAKPRTGRRQGRHLRPARSRCRAGSTGGGGGTAATRLASFQRRSLVWPPGPGTNLRKNGEQFYANQR